MVPVAHAAQRDALIAQGDVSVLEALTGTTYGPFEVVVAPDRVEAFTAAVGGHPRPGTPMFANAALFAAAPAFLEDEPVVPYTRSLIHSEQTYAWSRPLEPNETLSISGVVEGVRARGPLNFVTFSLTADSPNGHWLDGRSVFLMSDQAAGSTDDETEPSFEDRPPFDHDLGLLPLPEAGAEIEQRRCGASRSDLAGYAAASGDHNPIHLDHDAARSAGLGGVIVHGLLMASWMAATAARHGSLRSMALRFRNPLRPSVPAEVSGRVRSVDEGSAELDLLLAADDVRLVTARAVVTT